MFLKHILFRLQDLHCLILLLNLYFKKSLKLPEHRGGSRAAATSKMERSVIIFNGWKPLTITTKHFILDVVAALDPPLHRGTYVLRNFTQRIVFLQIIHPCKYQVEFLKFFFILVIIWVIPMQIILRKKHSNNNKATS